MARYQYVILGSAIPGREQEFQRWYDEQHLPDVMKIDGVVGAKRFNVLSQKTTGLGDVAWHSVAIYDIESDDPQAVVASISNAANTPAMPVTDAMTRTGLAQILVEKSREIP